MNSRRADTISSLLLLVLVVIFAVGMGRYYFVNRTIDKIHAEDARRVIGTDRVLEETVQNLEETLRERISYQFITETDPLDLTRVITSRKFLEKLGADKNDPDANVMRLAATVVGDDGTAAIVIRYLGHSHVLRLGDVLEGWKVSKIEKREVILRKGGQTKVLKNRPARENLASTGQMLSVQPPDDWADSGKGY
ncbi:hypothetical protein KQI63_15095 [bacterium]|nr:hypothetical protein [bacterium]